MGTVRTLGGRFVSVLVAMAVLFCAGAAIAEDCAKARKFYDIGKDLLNYEERRAAFQKAVDLCPSYAEAHVNLADAIENTAKTSADYDKAITEYKKAVKYKDNLLPAYLGLGMNYLRIGLDVKARDALKRALELDPANTWARGCLEIANRRISIEKNRIIRRKHDHAE